MSDDGLPKFRVGDRVFAVVEDFEPMRGIVVWADHKGARVRCRDNDFSSWFDNHELVYVQ